jgi:radical SAM protein
MVMGSENGYHQAPFLVLWEVTRACALSCRHCRADAQRQRSPAELDTGQALALLDHMRAEFGPVLVVFTGGDPLLRADLTTLIRHAAAIGLRPALTPSVTPLLTAQRIDELAAAGVRRFAISLDGADAETHDTFRGVPGTFAATCAVLDHLQRQRHEVQINSSIGRHNRFQLASLAMLAAWHDAVLWSVFLLVPTGRAHDDDLVSAADHERVYRELATIAATAPFDLKTTAGQPYYRVLAQRGRDPRGGLRARAPVNDGKGVVFIDHQGGVQPSGFLAITCGNVTQTPLADIYRQHPLFTALRDPARLGGKCGRCEYRDLCGGSRSRSHALTGDALAADPTCVYQPLSA